MQNSELLKKAADLGVTDGLGVVPLEEVLPIKTAIGQTPGEGAHEEEEEEKTDEGAPTQPPSTTIEKAPLTTPPIPPPIDTTTLPTKTQAFRHTAETVIV